MKKLFFLSLMIFSMPAFGYYNADIQSLCGSISDLYARYAPYTFNCDPGYFLPANSIACAPCPNGYSCDGGTYTFNETLSQGLSMRTTTYRTTNESKTCAANFPHDVVAKFQRNQHTCTSGQYLPANVDECTACPTGYTCGGGTYTFNENTNQGITANNINITWQDDNGNTIDSGTCSYGETINVPSTTPTKTGYTFAGWQVVSN